MDRRTKDVLRASATALGVATGLLALASTAQTPDGYIHASFGGPLDVFSSSNSADVLAIGDGSNDATELAALLKGPVGPAAKNGVPDSPYRVAYEAGAAPNATTGAVTVMPSVDPTFAPSFGKDPAIVPSKPVVDSQGRVDCTGAVSCKTDPSTNITTVTYPDGVVAVVQKINDLTVVAYKTLTEALPSEISSLLPPVPTAPPALTAVAPTPAAVPTPSVAPTSTPVPSPAPETAVPSIDPGPPAPRTAPSRGPRINVTTPSNDFSPGHSGTGGNAPAPNLPEKVKEAIGGVVDTVKDAVGAAGKALNPGASNKPDTTGSQGSGATSNKSDDSKSDDAGSTGP